MAALGNFIGGSYPTRSVNFDLERSYNLYLERAVQGQRGVSEGLFLARPGLKAYIQAGAAPVRQLFAQDGRTFAVAGGVFYELLPNQTAITRGVVPVDSHPASISSNGTGGHQLLVTSGGAGFIFDLTASTFTQIDDDGFPDPVVWALFFDGYFIALGSDGVFHLSALEDGLTWNGLDEAQESQASDKTRMIYRTHDNLWLFGSLTTAPWYDSGNPSFPFQPVPGSLIEHGILAPYSCATLDNTLFWLGQDPLGGGQVYRADGYTPQHISTPALETYLARIVEAGGKLSDAVGFAMQFDSHLFYGLYLPSAPTTPVYDVSTGTWFDWTRFNPDTMRHEPFRGRCHCWDGKRHLVGDRSSGTIYEASLVFYQDEVAA